MNYTDSTPIVALSVADFTELINTLLGREPSPSPQQRRLVYGLKGIEELFNCCHLTAQRHKKTFLAPAIKQRGRKIMQYNPSTGHRIKDPNKPGRINWLHSILKRRKQLPPDWQLTQYLWLATGGKSQFNSRLTVLKGRKVIAFPDIDAYHDWLRRTTDFPHLDLKVSDLLEKHATPKPAPPTSTSPTG